MAWVAGAGDGGHHHVGAVLREMNLGARARLPLRQLAWELSRALT